MALIRQLEQDITTVKSPFIIIHVVNNKNKMGAGVAKALYTKYPVVKEAYHNFLNMHPDKDLLGQNQMVRVSEHDWVVNMIAQNGYGTDGARYLSYPALDHCLHHVKLFAANFPDSKIYVPYKMGAGLAGGDWIDVRRYLSDHFSEVTICILPEEADRLEHESENSRQSQNRIIESETKPETTSD